MPVTLKEILFNYMIKLIGTRLLQSIFVIIMVSIVVFAIMHIAPGDPAILKLGKAASDPRNAELLENVRRQMGLDKPVIVQYFIWFKDIIRGDFGVSYRNNLKVIDLISQKIPVSLELVFAGLFIGVLIALPIGTLQSVNYRSKSDLTLYILTLLGISIPTFWLGLSLITVLSVKLGWLPPGGHVSFFVSPVENLSKLIMPAVSVGVYEAAIFIRFIRTDMVGVLTEDYIKMAEAKGLNRFNVVVKHGLRNSLVSFMTIFGMELGALVGNIVIVEQVFGWPGLGWLIFNAIQNRDYSVVQGAILFICFVFILSNLLIDISYFFLNPQFKEYLKKAK